MLLFFPALASLTTLNHLFLDKFITEHRDTFNSKTNFKGQCIGEFTPITKCKIKDNNIY